MYIMSSSHWGIDSMCVRKDCWTKAEYNLCGWVFCTKSPDYAGFRKEVPCQEFLTKLTAGSGKACLCGHQCTSIMHGVSAASFPGVAIWAGAQCKWAGILGLAVIQGTADSMVIFFFSKWLQLTFILTTYMIRLCIHSPVGVLKLS